MATNIVVRFIGDTRQLQTAFAQATASAGTMKTATRSLSTSLATAGSAWMNFGTKVSMVGIPIALAGGYAVKSAIDYEETVSKMTRLTNASAEDAKRWSEQIKDLAGDVGQGPQELAEALYFVASSGAPVAEAMNIVKSAAKGATAGLGEVQQVADMATSAINVYGAANLSAEDAMNILTEAVRLGKGEADQYAKVVGRITPVANQLGIEFNEVGAAMAVATNRGLSVAEAATGIRQTFMALVKPSEKASAIAAEMGTNFDNIRKIFREKGLLAGYQELQRLSGGNEEKMAALLPNVRGLNAYLNIMSEDTMPETIDVFKQMEDSTGELDKAFDKAGDTTKVKLDKAFADLKVVAIELGEEALPIVADVAEKLGDWFEKLSEVSPEMMKLIVTVAMIGIVAGPAAIAIGGMMRMLGLLLSPAGLALVALVGLAMAGKWLYDNWQPFTDFVDNDVIPTMKELGEIIKTDFPAGVKKMQDAWNSRGGNTSGETGWRKEILDSIGTISRAWDRFQVDFPTGITAIQDAWNGKGNTQGLTGWGANFVDGLGLIKEELWKFPGECQRAFDRVSQFIEESGIADAFQRNLEMIDAVMQSAIGIITAPWKIITSALSGDWSGAWDTITQVVTNNLKMIQAIITSMMANINVLTTLGMSGISAIISWIWQGIYNFVAGIATSIIRMVSNLWGSASDGLAQAAQFIYGTWSNIWNFVSGVIANVRQGASNMWSPVADTIGGALRTVVNAWNRLDFSIGPWTVPGWVPGIGGSTFHIPDIIPDVGFATGGIVSKPTVALMGEGYRKEVVFPVNNPERGYSLLAAAGVHSPQESSGGTVINYSPHFTLMNPGDAAGINEREMAWIAKTNGI